jgi:hypothetical protein
MTGPITDLFAALPGTWTLARTVTPDGVLDGMARFAARPDGGLDYHERGELVLPGGRFAAERRYLLMPHRDGFTVHFADADPRLFHHVTLAREADGSLTGAAPHPCGQDLYVTSYRFAPDGGFTIINRVSGPNKDYTVTSAYTRTAAQGLAA